MNFCTNEWKTAVVNRSSQVYILAMITFYLYPASGTGGGGAGGRVAVVVEDETQFTGKTSAYGGHSPDGVGGAGTVYKDENNVKSIIVDNLKAHSVVVSNKATTDMTNDELEQCKMP